MPTNTQATPGRELGFQAVHYLRKLVNFGDSGIATGIKVGDLPPGAEILSTNVKIKTVFNAGTTNVLTVGQNATSYNDFVSAGDVDETALGLTRVPRGGDVALSMTAPTPVYAKYTQTGGAATTGQAVITVEYVPNNDL